MLLRAWRGSKKSCNKALQNEVQRIYLPAKSRKTCVHVLLRGRQAFFGPLFCYCHSAYRTCTSFDIHDRGKVQTRVMFPPLDQSELPEVIDHSFQLLDF